MSDIHPIENDPAPAEALVELAVADVPPMELLDLAARLLVSAGGADGAAVYESTADGPVLVASAGAVGLESAGDGRFEVGYDVAGTPAGLLVTWSTARDLAAFQTKAADVLGRSLTRTKREERLVRREQHFVAAQRISHVGSYDFDITTNSNDWSDQLYRIYGREPGSFNASYERFLELVHPDDREIIIGVHQEALATLSTYEMEERICWPDGQVRTLASWGEVVPDGEGKPARMVGICWDITEEKANVEALRRSSERFQQLIQSAPDVVLVVSDEGLVVRANERLVTVFGWEPDQLRGRPVSLLLPLGVVAGETAAVDRDGREVPVDISTSAIELDGSPVTVAFVRDVSDRKQQELLAVRLHDNEVRRRHALEINDNVVQGLASVLYLLDLERSASAHAAARQTLAAARSMMSDLLADTGAALVPGELVRERGHVGTLEDLIAPEVPVVEGAVRVLLADDAPDIRMLLRFALGCESGLEVVGEAANGREAVDLAASLQPDVVVLDLSMPVMDGLQAIPELLRVCPALRIVVLSGFDEGRMRQVALDLGAHAYLEKGSATAELVGTLSGLFPDHVLGGASPTVADPDASLTFDGDMVVHELRTPLTVITGMLGTLRDRRDVLPAATMAELVGAALRNAAHMADLLDAVSDARRASNGQLPVVREPTDIGALVRDAVTDLCTAHGWCPAVVSVAEGVVADVDPMRIRQVLANLLSNAYKFSPSGTPVSVTVHGVNGVAEIAVSDEGPGVPPERRDELFVKFARLGQVGPGMGLGLYISREIARAHGGDLVLRDGGDGATFALSVPMVVTSPATTH